MERLLEILCGLIMVLTFTCSFSVASSNRADVRTLLIAALGCNIAWGIIDAVFYLMGNFAERGRGLLALRAACKADNPAEARDIIAGAMPPLLASVLEAPDFAAMHQRLRKLPDPPQDPWLEKNDWIGALGVLLIEFVAVLPVALPFVFISNARLALRVSNAVAVVLLFAAGYKFGSYAGYRPWGMGLAMVVFGGALIGVAIALGG